MQPGKRIWVNWGRFGTVEAKVIRVSRNGIIYAARWNARRERWTSARRLYPWRGGWSTEQLAE